MLTPLYPISTEPATITVVAPGALAAATSVPVAPLPIALPAGYILDFGSAKFAKLSGARAAGALSLGVEALPTALDAGDEVDVLGSPASSLLSEEYTKLGTEKQLAMALMAEQLLGLGRPAYTGERADRLGLAVVLQVNFMIAQKITPLVNKTTSNSAPGNATTYRDRWINPEAAAIVEAVTGRRQVRFAPPMAGV